MIKLLIVDDEPRIADLLKKRFEALQYVVLTAADGVEAMEKVQAYHPDLIILDILMPKKDGYRFLEELRAKDGRDKHIPVIVLSARRAMKDVFNPKLINAFVEKPFDEKKLTAMVEDLTRDIKKQKGKIFRALVIGMNWEVIRPIKTFLEAKGFLVFTASDAAKAAEGAVKHEPDIIFCASLTAGMDVTALCKFLKGMPSAKKTPFVIYDNGGSLTPEAAERMGAARLLQYEVHDDLTAQIDVYLREYVLNRDA